MHLYPCVYLYFYATNLMIILYTPNIRFFLISIFHIPYTMVNSATLSLVADTIISKFKGVCVVEWLTRRTSNLRIPCKLHVFKPSQGQAVVS